jgi:biotin operon repressor
MTCCELLIEAFLADGFSQADVGRELGVTRQAIQKVIKVGREPRGAKAKS